VGLLDADVYGPSLPRMMGLQGARPTTSDGKTLDPPRAHGLPVMSIGFLVDADQPMAWRGPMATQALTQMLADTRWGPLDYLVVDMPPGTGDIQLTLAQRVPVSGAVIVTTPQEIALLDARKGLQMFRKVGVPVLGIVENMGLHRCPACGHESHIFDAGGGRTLAGRYDTALLGELPLDGAIREQADSGRPTVVADPASPAAAAYHAIARRAAGALAASAIRGAVRMPVIKVEGD
jgi:ATP-binding protein involved in chromosome partitioning